MLMDINLFRRQEEEDATGFCVTSNAYSTSILRPSNLRWLDSTHGQKT